MSDFKKKEEKDFSWLDPNSVNYRADLIQLVRDVADQKAGISSRDWKIHVEAEDLVSELYIHLLKNPRIFSDNKFPARILHGEAAKYCFNQRKEQGAAILGTDTLHEILKDFNNIPEKIYKILYGPVFAKSGKPSGTYLEIIEQEYKHKNRVVGASGRKNLSRAVARLAEVISGIMVGTPDSFTKYESLAEVPSYEMEPFKNDYVEDSTLKPYVGIYYCENGHWYRINTGAKPKRGKIGQRDQLGYYVCRCGSVLNLDEVK